MWRNAQDQIENKECNKNRLYGSYGLLQVGYIISAITINVNSKNKQKRYQKEKEGAAESLNTDSPSFM